MKVSGTGCLTLLSLLALPCGLLAGGSAFGDLSGIAAPANFQPAPAASAPAPLRVAEAEQYLPPNNSEPGFNWPPQKKSGPDGDFIYTGKNPTYLKYSEADSATMIDGFARCRLEPKTLYKLRAVPVFEGQHLIADLETPLPGCAFTRGYVYLPHISSTSAGGLWELPVNVRAFLDTLAYAEGTKEHYNFIFTFVTFKSYADHPRQRICSGGLCSTAAGRYQFLSRTWDPLAQDLGLTDFTPPNQEKAALELIRRAGAYKNVANSAVYANFSKAVSKLNTIWASLPGSPYGQPTHPLANLWTVYKAALAGYK
ncbi:MAG: glycoside hydrolase family 104 protein [Elusimicrobiota bacterium]